MLPGFIARIDDLVASLTTEGTGMCWYLMLIYSNRWEDWGKQQLDALCLSFSLVLSIDIHRFTTNPCMACNGMYIIVHTYMHLWSFIHLYIYIFVICNKCTYIILEWHASMDQWPLKLENLHLYAVYPQNGQFNQLKHIITYIRTYFEGWKTKVPGD